MKINRTLCNHCGKEIDKVIVHDYHFACPYCDRILSDKKIERRIINP